MKGSDSRPRGRSRLSGCESWAVGARCCRFAGMSTQMEVVVGVVVGREKRDGAFGRCWSSLRGDWQV